MVVDIYELFCVVFFFLHLPVYEHFVAILLIYALVMGLFVL